MNKIKEWEISWGEGNVKVTPDMVVHALDIGISATQSLIENNKFIRHEQRIKNDWEFSALILERLRKEFESE